jgi:peptide/nickel transport system permease protein
MLSYIIRRALYTLPILFGVSLIVFILFNIAAENPVYMYLGKNATPEAVALMERQMGLDKPLWMQYLNYLWDLLRLDFGRSWETKQNISSMFMEGIGPSLALAVPAFIISNMVALVIAMAAAFYHQSPMDRGLVVVSVLGMSISALAFIIAGQYYLAFVLNLFPISGYESGPQGIPYLALPILIWVVASLGTEVRYFRTVILEEINREYVITARAKGLKYPAVLFKHVLKNAMIPIITRWVIALPFLITGSLLLENFFGIPGLGYMLVNALNAHDFPVIKAMTFFITLLYILANLAGDIIYSYVDPRITLE